MLNDGFSADFFREAADEYLRSLLLEDEADGSVIICDPSQPDTPIIYASDAFLAQTGYEREEALGRNCRFLQGPDTNPAAVEAIRMGVAARTRFTIDLLNYRKDGAPYRSRLRIRPVFDQEGALAYLVGTQSLVD